MKSIFLLGRLVFGGFFLYSGIHHFQERKAMAQYTAAKGVPEPELAVTATGALLIAGGASVLLGIKPKWGTLAIISFLAGVFGNARLLKSDDPAQKQNDMVHFMKNFAMLGAAMALMGTDEPWPMSVPIGQPNRLERIKKYVRQVAA